MSDLDKLFKDYEDNVQKERQEMEQRKTHEEELRNMSADALRKTVLPVLKELSTKIQEKGYSSNVAERIDNYTYPNVELIFAPRAKQTKLTNSVYNSTLRFAHTVTGEIEMKEQIKAGEGKSFSGYYDPNSKIEPSKISEGWVRAKAMAFIEKALKAS